MTHCLKGGSLWWCCHVGWNCNWECPLQWRTHNLCSWAFTLSISLDKGLLTTFFPLKKIYAPVIKSDTLSLHGERMHQISSIFSGKSYFSFATIEWFFPFYRTWLKVVHSVASGLVQRVIVIDITSFDKSALHTLSDISPSLARGIPYFLLEPNKITTIDVKSPAKQISYKI